jgi:protease YdgD
MSGHATRYGDWLYAASTALCVIIFALSGLSISKSDAIERPHAAVPNFPWSAVGKLYNGAGEGCTAIAIEADQLLTAAHCIFNQRTGLFLQPSSLHFLLGLDGDDYRVHALVESYTTRPQYDPRRPLKTASTDWAVLRLRQPLPPEYRPVPLATDLPENGAIVLIGGYGQDRAFAMSVDGNCRILQTIRGLLIHNCHAARGYSGAPLIQLASATKPTRIVGIHVARGYFQGAKVNIAIPAATITR